MSVAIKPINEFREQSMFAKAADRICSSAKRVGRTVSSLFAKAGNAVCGSDLIAYTAGTAAGYGMLRFGISTSLYIVQNQPVEAVMSGIGFAISGGVAIAAIRYLQCADMN